MATLETTIEWIACEYGDDDARLPELEHDLAAYRRQAEALQARAFVATHPAAGEGSEVSDGE
jgi:hypothetical protein